MGILRKDFNDSVDKGLEDEKSSRIWYRENLEELADHIGSSYRDVNKYLDDKYHLGSQSLVVAIKEEREER